MHMLENIARIDSCTLINLYQRDTLVFMQAYFTVLLLDIR